jgi:peroxiredoxin family protein
MNIAKAPVAQLGATGAMIYACKASVDMFKLKKEDCCEQIDSAITLGDFYEMAQSGHIVFT